MLTCWQVSTRWPLEASVNELARPPSRARFQQCHPEALGSQRRRGRQACQAAAEDQDRRW